MNSRYYTPRERRALNMVWTAAASYDFEPDVLAYQQDGVPDLYMNTIIGYVYRSYPPQELHTLFALFENSFQRALYDGLIWLALEHMFFQRNMITNPGLSALRQEAAHLFFRQEQTRTRQEWMVQNSLLYTLQSARWREVLGKPAGLISPRSREIYQALQFRSSLDFPAFHAQILALFCHYFHFHETMLPRILHLHLSGTLAALFLHLMPSRLEHNELLQIGIPDTQDVPCGKHSVSQHMLKAFGRQKLLSEKSVLTYIEQVFGKSLYTPSEQAAIEHLLCTGRHFQSHLYFTNGQTLTSKKNTDVKKSIRTDAQIAKVTADAAKQQKRNAEFYNAHRLQYQNDIKQLSSCIKNAVQAAQEPLSVPSRYGLLSAPLIWRTAILKETQVFSNQTESEWDDFSVALLLDASASRMGEQEQIAAQAYVITKSLQENSIPVLLASFLSFKGYTIIKCLCDYCEKAKAERTFQYYAAGWNRDGLALRAAGYLMRKAPSKKKLLIVLTDATPNDDRDIPADRDAKRPLPIPYADKAAVEDTAEEARKLRKAGIHVIGILTGTGANVDTARQIYGNDFVRIQKIDQFASTVGGLLTHQINALAQN